MSALLKQKSKINAVPKDRVQYEAFDFGKRVREIPRIDPNKVSNTQMTGQTSGRGSQQSILKVDDVLKENERRNK